MPQGFWAEVECAFLNSYQARWQYAADTVGLGFAQGKTMLWRRADLEQAGGIRALGAEIAEDAAATKVVRRAGKRVRLVDRAFGQPLGRRSARAGVVAAGALGEAAPHDISRRSSCPRCCRAALHRCSPRLMPRQAADVPALAAVAALAAFWYGCDAYLCARRGLASCRSSLLAWVMRDLMLPVLWAQAWLGNTFSWRGNEMKPRRRGRRQLSVRNLG